MRHNNTQNNTLGMDMYEGEGRGVFFDKLPSGPREENTNYQQRTEPGFTLYLFLTPLLIYDSIRDGIQSLKDKVSRL